YGPYAHLIGLAPGNGKTPEDTERLQAATLREAGIDHDRRRCSVGELTRVAGSNHPAGHRRTDLGHTLIGGVGADTLIRREGGLAGVQAACVAVRDTRKNLDGDDFVVELACCLCRRGTLLALCAVLILALPGDLVAFGDLLGRLQHAPVDGGF